jgi:hypothetical protein
VDCGGLLPLSPTGSLLPARRLLFPATRSS